MKKVFFILFCALLTHTNTPAMQPAATRIASKYGMGFTKKIFSKTMTAASWALSFGPFAAKGIGSLLLYKYDKKFLDQLPEQSDPFNSPYHYIDGATGKRIYTFHEADEQVTNFIKNEGKKITSKEIDSIKITNLIGGGINAAVLSKTMIITTECYSKIKQSIDNNDHKEQALFGGIFQHEWSHIKNNDALMRGIAYLSIPLCNHWSLKILKNTLPVAQKTKSFFAQQRGKIFSGSGKYVLNNLILKAFQRQQEQKADNGICNDIDTLEGLKDFLHNNNEATKAVIQDPFYNSPTLSFQRQFPRISNVILPLLSDHPTDEQRIAQLEKRIQKLKNEQKQ